MLDLTQAIGKSWGETIQSNLGNEFILMEPTVEDKLMKVRRLTQIVYPKDAALIIFKTGIRSGMKVIETGVGSGALTIALANSVAPEGKIYSYEKREEFIKNAADNIRYAGLIDYVEFFNRDARDGFDQTDVDVAIIDLPSPWYGIPSAYESLRGGGRIASISPTYNQVERSVQCMEDTGFVNIETLELILRNYQVKQGKTRPRDRMVGHTGFLTFARKAIAS
ncbi:MAG: methyltransferase domain-containing protein [Candidatus Dadabacteria bacterium]|nr:methyltransferase domain-containing protein [Candidatus Dadabacteria bacterium]NIQ12994.1 methyltransferase domain-containing protein [Candidatus Dadabacteria bacterium]